MSIRSNRVSRAPYLLVAATLLLSGGTPAVADAGSDSNGNGSHARTERSAPRDTQRPGTVVEHPGPYADPAARQGLSSGSATAELLQERSESLRTSLQQARDHAKRVADALNGASAGQALSSGTRERLRSEGREIAQALRSAQRQNELLQQAAQSRPGVAASSQYQSYQSSIRDLRGIVQAIRARADDGQYWQNASRMRTDADRLAQGIDCAIARLDSLRTDRLGSG